MRCVIVATVNGVANVLIDGVITNNQISPGDKGSNSTLTITGRDLTALMDQSDWSGFPFPGLPARGARRAAARQVRLLRRRSAHHSERAHRRAAADREHSEPAGNRSQIHPLAGGRGRLRVLHRPRPGSRDEHGLLGPADQGGRRCSRRSAPIWTPTPTSKACTSRSIRRRTGFRSSTSMSRKPASPFRSRSRRSPRSIRRSARSRRSPPICSRPI